MAGLSAAARARELGAAPVVYEKGTRPGGSMLLSSCVIWRFREWDEFRAECPGGDETLQRVVWEQLDEGLAWLESLGAPVVEHDTGNPRTVGKRFDPHGLAETLARVARDVRLIDVRVLLTVGCLTSLGDELNDNRVVVADIVCLCDSAVLDDRRRGALLDALGVVIAATERDRLNDDAVVRRCRAYARWAADE